MRQIESEEGYGNTRLDYDYEEIIDNIADWVDEDENSKRGGAESNLYSQVIADNNLEVNLPPNRPFRTLKELKMVSGVTNKIYNLLAPHITVYGNKGINPNYASTHLLKALDPVGMTDEVIANIEERKNDPAQGLFQNEQDFLSFLDGFIDTQPIKELNVPFYFGSEHNFMIKSTGISRGVQKEIIAIVYDIDATASNLAKARAKSNQNNNQKNSSKNNSKGPTSQNPTANTSSQTTTPNDQPPTIVYWYEP